ncbi:MAG: Re/Si-specific NAD(P)(+) transhydrogenase subunit alpha [Candidatus Eiseniibacteriota bacterium]
MIVSIPREIARGEARVAAVPETVGRLRKTGLDVHVERGAGEAAGFRDDAYADAGATLESDVRALWGRADAVLKVREPGPVESTGAHELDLLKEGAILVGFLKPAERPDLLPRYLARRVTAFSLEKLPRTSRAQKMDALSSMSTVAGYKAVLIAAARLPRFFPLLMTAAGTVPPARVFILGAGVAGLQAIATARRLGAVVEAFDVRPAVREEAQSLGATFVGPTGDAKAAPGPAGSGSGSGAYAGELTEDEKKHEQDLLAKHVATADVVISTAMIPGRKAPVLLTAEMVRTMRPGAVIVDLAAEAGGNCELTRPGEDVTAGGVTVLGPVNLAATLPGHASQMYARNLASFVLLFAKDGRLDPDFSDDILHDSCIAHAGQPGPPPVERTLAGSDR